MGVVWAGLWGRVETYGPPYEETSHKKKQTSQPAPNTLLILLCFTYFT